MDERFKDRSRLLNELRVIVQEAAHGVRSIRLWFERFWMRIHGLSRDSWRLCVDMIRQLIWSELSTIITKSRTESKPRRSGLNGSSAKRSNEQERQ